MAAVITKSVEKHLENILRTPLVATSILTFKTALCPFQRGPPGPAGPPGHRGPPGSAAAAITIDVLMARMSDRIKGKCQRSHQVYI